MTHPIGTGPHAAGSPQRLRLLLVDDNAESVETMQSLFELDGHETRVAIDGADALRIARAMRPDVILLDIGLPGMDGHDVARAIRRDANLTATVLVAVTGYGSEDDRRRGREAGFDVHLVKPLDYEELKRLVPVLAAASTRCRPSQD